MNKTFSLSVMSICLGLLCGCEQLSELLESDKSEGQVKQLPQLKKEHPDRESPVEVASDSQEGDAAVDALLIQAEEALSEGQLPQARQILEQLKQSELNAEQQSQLAALVSELMPRASTSAASHDHAWHESQLQAAQQHADKDQLDEAEVRLRELLRYNPTPAQQKHASSITARIARRRLAIGRLKEAVTRLASGSRAEVRQAQNQLFEESAAAVPLLIATLAEGQPATVRNVVETLRILRRPDAALPALVDVLSQSEHAELWPLVTAEIQHSGVAGGGERLLELALQTELLAQRVAALEALSQVVDPPVRTLPALLPWLEADGQELTAALNAATAAVMIHGQHDLVTRRGLELDLEPQEMEQLSTLPGRLLEVISANGEAASSARKLAIAIRLIPAEPLPEVKLLAFSAQASDGPAMSVLDGDYTTVDPKRMWRHSINRRGSIVLDLGALHTVAGVRIWNLNEPSKTQCGWKTVSIYVGETPSSTTSPTAQGVVPQAPGASPQGDYGTTIPVRFARGRYVRLDAESLWTKQGYSGLTEIQVLGF